MAYVTLNKIPLKIKSIKEDPQLSTNNRPYAGGTGAYTSNLGHKGRQLELTVHGDNKNIGQLRGLKNNRGVLPLVSISQAAYNGFYRIVSFTLTESKKGLFEAVITLQEHKNFNSTKMNYKTYTGLITKKPKLKTKKTKVTTKKKK